MPTPNHTEQLNNAKKATELGIAQMIEQDELNKQTLLATVQKMLRLNEFRERAKQIQEKVQK